MSSTCEPPGGSLSPRVVAFSSRAVDTGCPQLGRFGPGPGCRLPDEAENSGVFQSKACHCSVSSASPSGSPVSPDTAHRAVAPDKSAFQPGHARHPAGKSRMDRTYRETDGPGSHHPPTRSTKTGEMSTEWFLMPFVLTFCSFRRKASQTLAGHLCTRMKDSAPSEVHRKSSTNHASLPLTNCLIEPIKNDSSTFVLECS